MAEFMRLREHLENEMDARFDAQDEIIDNLSLSIKTFQDTMKIVGQTVCWLKHNLTLTLTVQNHQRVKPLEAAGEAESSQLSLSDRP